ncbi:MAG: energy-coupling factor transporter transmembrane protein EcfT [Clostridia bacterium]|nr:energy-coupling factor transporter transmembrane protein EcfT [Clostridiales bacterium]MBQ6805202.1 energy-coupling factor transporter transmembrane protein EcfT [Clostridia bacterium]MDD6682222.1 energy-coupling factor transporter transmembrane component T [Clostridiales bacterium]
MLNNITLGQYYPADSIVHKLDPRVKILLLVALIVGIFLGQNLLSYVPVALFLFLAARLSKVPFSMLLKGLKPLRFILVFTFVLNIFFLQGETPLLNLGFAVIKTESVITAIHYCLRLVLLVLASSLLTLTTAPVTLTDGLERLLSPLRVIHFPAHEMAMMMTIALRFIPTLLEEADKIMKAQTARGADFESGNLLNRAKAMVPLLVPLFVGAFRRAGDLAMAMEARCYHGGEGRTRLRVLKCQKNDYLSCLIMALVILLIILCGKVY